MLWIILVILLLILIAFILYCCVCNTTPYDRDEQQMEYLRQYKEQCKEHHKDK